MMSTGQGRLIVVIVCGQCPNSPVLGRVFDAPGGGHLRCVVPEADYLDNMFAGLGELTWASASDEKSRAGGHTKYPEYVLSVPAAGNVDPERVLAFRCPDHNRRPSTFGELHAAVEKYRRKQTRRPVPLVV